jgi:hypothetical protein
MYAERSTATKRKFGERYSREPDSALQQSYHRIQQLSGDTQPHDKGALVIASIRCRNGNEKGTGSLRVDYIAALPLVAKYRTDGSVFGLAFSPPALCVTDIQAHTVSGELLQG